MKEKGSYPFGSDGFFSRAENYPLSKAMVDYDQQRVKARGGGEVSDKVTRDLLEQSGCMRSDQCKQEDSGVCVRLVFLACGIALDIFSHKLHETQPPELGGDKLASFEVTSI